MYNWLTGSSVDTLADYTLSSESETSLLVFEKKRAERLASWRVAGANFGSKRLTNPTDETDSRSAGSLALPEVPKFLMSSYHYSGVINMSLFIFQRKKRTYISFRAAERERRADILRLRRRFLKDKEKENIKFAKREIQSQRTQRVEISHSFVAVICVYTPFFILQQQLTFLC